MTEDRLRETFDRVAAGGPAEAGAFDRFQRHRRTHRSRRLAGATWKGIELRPTSPELRPT